MRQVSCIIRPAAKSEWEYALSLIPEITSSAHLPSVIFVASPTDNPQLILGCGASLPVIRDALKPGFPFFVRVLLPYRRKGIGRLIVAELADYVLSWNVPHLLSWHAYGHGEQYAFLKACGFDAYLKVHKFQVVRESAHILLDLLARFQQKNDSFKGLQLKLLTEANVHEIASLYCAHFMVSYEVGLQTLKQMTSLPQASLLSSIAYLENNPIGFIIGYLDTENLPKVDFWMIGPKFRNSPISLVLLCHFVKNAYEHGYSVARFDCNDDARSTLKIAARLNAETLEVCESFAYALDAQ